MTQQSITAQGYVWREVDGSRTPGVAVFRKNHFVGFMSPAEAVALAHQLADAAEAQTRKIRTRQESSK